MYSFVDQPVQRLSQGSRFVLWAMRSWMKAVSDGTCPPRALARNFHGMGAQRALSPFHVAMSFLNAHARESIVILPVNRLRISEDEAILLALWRDALGAATRPARDATLNLLVGDRAKTIAAAIDASADALAAAELAPGGLGQENTAETGR